MQWLMGVDVSHGKIIMIVLLLWLLPSAWLPLLGYIYEVPYSLVEIDPEAENFRLLTIRSAAFMTVVYFIISYLRHQRPLSSVLPVIVFNFWLVLFRIAYVTIFSEPLSEWFVILAFALILGFLTVEYLRDSNKIFKDSW
ncbi:MAG: hypothetical protein ACPGXJ_05350 [Pseudomonadales bacterium]